MEQPPAKVLHFSANEHAQDAISFFRMISKPTTTGIKKRISDGEESHSILLRQRRMCWRSDDQEAYRRVAANSEAQASIWAVSTGFIMVTRHLHRRKVPDPNYPILGSIGRVEGRRACSPMIDDRERGRDILGKRNRTKPPPLC
jgi:hypothetical protein